MGLIWGTWCPAVCVRVQMFESSGGQVNECSYKGECMVGTMRQLSVCDALSLKQKAGWVATERERERVFHFTKFC